MIPPAGRFVKKYLNFFPRNFPSLPPRILSPARGETTAIAEPAKGGESMKSKSREQKSSQNQSQTQNQDQTNTQTR